jgi:hypothetical protein
MTPDVGWSYNPGSAAFGTDQTLHKVIETRDPQLREQVIQSLNNSRERQLAFSVWAKRTYRWPRGVMPFDAGFQWNPLPPWSERESVLNQPGY